jgi:hypothetical protein
VFVDFASSSSLKTDSSSGPKISGSWSTRYFASKCKYANCPSLSALASASSGPQPSAWIAGKTTSEKSGRNGLL